MIFVAIASPVVLGVANIVKVAHKVLKVVDHYFNFVFRHSMCIHFSAFFVVPCPVGFRLLKSHLVLVLVCSLDVFLHFPQFNVSVVYDDQR